MTMASSSDHDRNSDKGSSSSNTRSSNTRSSNTSSNNSNEADEKIIRIDDIHVDGDGESCSVDYDVASPGKLASVDFVFQKDAKQSPCNFENDSNSESTDSKRLRHAKSAIAYASGVNVDRDVHPNANLDVDVETGIARGTKTNKPIAKPKPPGDCNTDHENTNHTAAAVANEADESDNNNNNNCAHLSQSSSSTSNLTPKQQQTILRTTPGAFAINNPLSSSYSGDRPLLEQRQSLMTGGTFTATVLGASCETADNIIPSQDDDEEMDDNISNLSDSVEGSDDQQSTENNILREPTTASVVAAATPCLSAIRVGHEFEVYDGEIVGDETDDKSQDGTKQKTKFLFGGLIVLLLGIAAALLVVLTSNNPRFGGGSANDGSGASTTGQASTEEERLKEYLVSIIAPISGPAGGRVFDRGGKDTSMDRISALTWMVDDLAGAVEFGGQEFLHHSIPEWRILQRYVLALLYFSTEGELWDEQSNFLSRENECLWIESTPSHWRAGDAILGSTNEITGVSCDKNGRVQGLHLRWNDLSGTLPDELCYFKDSIEELDVGGGSISGRIPPSIAKMTKLKTLALNDNCFSGAIPEGISTDLPLLERFSVINNGDLHGSLNGFCSSNEYAKEGILAIATECPVPYTVGDDDDSKNYSSGWNAGGVECECCICCDRNNYDCFDPQSGHSWKSHNFEAKGKVFQNLKSFDRRKECRTEANKNWILEKCPCYTKKSAASSTSMDNSNKNSDATFAAAFQYNASLSFECTSDCDQEGALDALGWYW